MIIIMIGTDNRSMGQRLLLQICSIICDTTLKAEQSVRGKNKLANNLKTCFPGFIAEGFFLPLHYNAIVRENLI